MQLYPVNTSSMSGAAIALYTCICFDSGPNTLSKVNVLELDFSITTCISPFFVLHSMTENDPAFFSEAFLGLMARSNFTEALFFNYSLYLHLTDT